MKKVYETPMMEVLQFIAEENLASDGVNAFSVPTIGKDPEGWVGGNDTWW